MYRKSKIAIALVMCIGLITSGQSAQGYSPPISSVVTKPTTVTKAKSLIRSLYYGYQQASYQGWASHKKFILANNYPGMYTNPKGCLDKLSRYNDIMPDLSSVAKDANWKMPKGVYLNKLSGKKPAGETFVFQANNEGTQVFNHVAILKGKAYFFLWICVKPTISSEISINREYLKNAAVLADEEDSLLSRYNSVTGVNYTSEAIAYLELASLIPDVQILIAKIGAIPTLNAETRAVNQSWISAWANYLNAWSLAKTAVETGDSTLIPEANDYIISARNYMSQAITLFQALKR